MITAYIKKCYSKYVPQSIRQKVYHWKSYKEFKEQQEKHQVTLASLRNKPVINVVFFTLYDTVWKYGDLYEILDKHPHFNPLILVCPVVNQDEKYRLQEMEKCYQYFRKKEYTVLRSYDPVTKKYIDVKKELKPDLIFYTNPYEGLIDNRYYITQFPDILTAYVPYAFMSVVYDWTYDLKFHNLLWTFFIETSLHKHYIERHQCLRGKNVFVSGFPGCDCFMSMNQAKNDVWKIKDRKIRRIIWAPHHLINEGQRGSNFLEYCDIMPEIARRYEGRLQIAFKPHPLLKKKLEQEKGWGNERTNAYYRMWNKLANGQLEEGTYEDLFLSSDALIHDCGSFITEYLFTGRPSLFMLSRNADKEAQNEYGKQALAVHYISESQDEVIRFIEDVVLKGKDPMYEKRKEFLERVAYPPEGRSAAANIAKYLGDQFKCL